MSPIFAFRYDTPAPPIPRDVLMIFFASPIIEIESLATVIEEEIEANLVPDEVLIVLRDTSFDHGIKLLGEASLSEATFARLGGRATISVLSYDQHGAEARRHHIGGPPALRNIMLGDFKRRALTGIFKARQGFVEATTTYHFENPSGRHTQKFIRLANILARGAEIAFIGFCALPFIADGARAAFLDTPSLYAIVAAINEQRASFVSGNAAIIADNFGSYSGLQGYGFDRQEESLVLISASSSGSMAARFIEEHGFEPERVVHLLFLGENQSRARNVCDLGWDKDHNPNGYKVMPRVETQKSCSMCAEGSVAIKLQGDQFDIAPPAPGSLLIKKTDAPSGLTDLMGRSAGKGIYAVGLGRTSGSQPRQFEVDVGALVANSAFEERLDYVLRRAVPASLSHVVAIDERSLPLAGRMATAARGEGHSVQIVERTKIGDMDGKQISAIGIAATVIESGRSLLDVSRDLRTVAPTSPQLYLVGCSKTTDEERRESLQRTLVQTGLHIPHEYIQVERIVLPQSSQTNAWSAERELLIDPEVSALIPAPLKSFVVERRKRLGQRSKAMVDGLFVGNQPTLELSLQPGFVFWPRKTSEKPHSQADVFFTIASVLQQLRANAERSDKTSSIKSNWFQQTILAPGNFGRFNDDIIQASLLRAAYPYELNYTNSPSDSRELGRLIARIIEAAQSPRGGAAAEFLVALATRRLQLCPADIAGILEIPDSTLVTVAFLQAVCRRRLRQ